MSGGHTPGPWLYIDAEVRADMQFSKLCVIRGAGKQVASFSWQTPSRAFPSREESKANARLISAAPELLEALTNLVNSFEKHRPKEHWDAARTAIAKATGGMVAPGCRK